MNKSFINLKTGILILTLLSIVGISTIITYISYKSQWQVYEKETLTRLRAISQTLASQINGDDLFYLYSKYPSEGDINTTLQDSVYQKIHEKLKMTQEINGLKTPIYTLLYHPKDNHFHFGVTSAEEPYWMHNFEKFPQKLLDNYETTGYVRPYSSENGTWLSAFCAIHRSDHKTHAGVVQVDINFDDYKNKALSALYSNIMITLLIVGTIAILIYFSISSILKQQQELAASERALSTYRKELIANVSHDLRTPLASIQGYIETLLMPELSLSKEDQEKYLNTALNSTQRLKDLVTELFELSRLESKDRKLKLENTNLGELVHDIFIGLKIEAEKSDIELRHDIPLSLSQVKVDVGLIERVFQNLLSNSLKYCPAGSWVKVSAAESPEHIHVYVEDNGGGMEEGDLEILFERMYKGKNKKSGSGLGLAIVKGVLDLHKSAYSASNNADGGLTFSFTLQKRLD